MSSDVNVVSKLQEPMVAKSAKRLIDSNLEIAPTFPCIVHVAYQVSISSSVNVTVTLIQKYLDHPLNEEFLEAWRLDVAYRNDYGKALIRWGNNGISVILYLENSVYSFDQQLGHWKRRPRYRSNTILNDRTISVFGGSMLYVGQFQNGSVHGKGETFVALCGEGNYLH